MHTSQVLVNHRVRARARCGLFGGNTADTNFTIMMPICRKGTLVRKRILRYILASVACLSAGERVLPPVPEHWPGRCEAQPLHQCQLRPRLQCLPELLCCDRYNTAGTRSCAKRVNTAAVGERRLRRGCQASHMLFCGVAPGPGYR